VLANGHIPSFSWTDARAVTDVADRPPNAVAQLLVDQGACLGFIEVDLRGCFLATCDQVQFLRFGGLLGSRLNSLKMSRNSCLIKFETKKRRLIPLPYRVESTSFKGAKRLGADVIRFDR
jgi:hypothetical protein